MPNDPLTWFAIVHDNLGYVLDAYPEERASCRREFGKRIVGEYRSESEALAAINERLSHYQAHMVVRGRPDRVAAAAPKPKNNRKSPEVDP